MIEVALAFSISASSRSERGGFGAGTASPGPIEASRPKSAGGSQLSTFSSAALAVAEAAKRGANGDSGNSLRANMPGTVAAIHVATGDRVEAGEVLAVLESMKLFMELKSPASGTVSQIGARAGATVAAGDVLVAIEPD